MLKYVIGRGVVVYQGETDAEAFARDKAMREHNEGLDRLFERMNTLTTCPGCGYPSGWHTPICRATDHSDLGR